MKKPLYNRYERFVLLNGYSATLKLDYLINKLKSAIGKQIAFIFKPIIIKLTKILNK